MNCARSETKQTQNWFFESLKVTSVNGYMAFARHFATYTLLENLQIWTVMSSSDQFREKWRGWWGSVWEGTVWKGTIRKGNVRSEPFLMEAFRRVEFGRDSRNIRQVSQQERQCINNHAIDMAKLSSNRRYFEFGNSKSTVRWDHLKKWLSGS